MATITGLTAERMLEIEAASVVDGDVVGNDLILARKDGTIINAGNVRGGPGPIGPMGSSLQVVTAQQLLDIGNPGQIRAGRQFSVADFTNMGLAPPLGLWNLSNANDSSGNNRHLTIKGGVPFGVGINGLASTAAVFAGSSAQALYIPDAAGGPFALRTGTFGIWHRTSRKNYANYFFARTGNPSGTWSWYLGVQANGTVIGSSFDGASALGTATGIIDVCDDRWHFIVYTIDGMRNRIYVDGMLDASVNAGAGIMYTGAAPVTIGGYAGSDPATVTPTYARLDEAFIHADVLNDEQVRNLYCASVPHALGSVPKQISMFIRRARRGGVWATTDFPAQPVRLHNFANGAITDQGSNNVPLTNPGFVTEPGPDGSANGSYRYGGAGGVGMSASDAGLPSGLSPRSVAVWFKAPFGAPTAYGTIVGWGTTGTSADLRLIHNVNGQLQAQSGADAGIGNQVNDNQWHLAVIVEDNTDPIAKRKLYNDGTMVMISNVMASLTLAGAARFRIGANPDGTSPFTGQIGPVAVYAGALTSEQVRKLFDISSRILAPSQEAPFDHIEAVETARLLAIFDQIPTSDALDLSVMA